MIGNTVADDALSGIKMLRTEGTFIADNVVSGNGEAGLFLDRKTDATVLGNRFGDNGLSGMIVMGSSGRFERNRFEGNAEHGVYLTKRGCGAFTENLIDSNRGHGVAIEADSRAELRGNRIQRNRAPEVIGQASATN